MITGNADPPAAKRCAALMVAYTWPWHSWVLVGYLLGDTSAPLRLLVCVANKLVTPQARTHDEAVTDKRLLQDYPTTGRKAPLSHPEPMA